MENDRGRRGEPTVTTTRDFMDHVPRPFANKRGAGGRPGLFPPPLPWPLSPDRACVAGVAKNNCARGNVRSAPESRNLRGRNGTQRSNRFGGAVNSDGAGN